MALVNDAINDVNYVVNKVSSRDLSSPENCGVSASSGSPQGFVYYPSDHNQTVDNNNSSLIFGNSNGSFVNFGQNGQPVNNRGDYSVFSEGDCMNYGYNFWNNPNGFETSTAGFGNGIDGTGKDWLFCDATVVATTGAMQESLTSDSASGLKRPATGEISKQASKKQYCSGSTGKSKTKTKASSKDPQSTAAKIRRERISERLKTLQELVPNGNKVDLVTMLEKAVGYVKFLQLQVKVLATDEFWPVQGGKAPDISQVKEAIDAILSSQRNGASNSKTDQS